MCRSLMLAVVVAAVLGSTCYNASAPAQTPEGPFDPRETSVDALQEALRTRRTTCRAVVEYYLARIDAYNRKGPALNAVQTVNPRAVAEAERLDVALRTNGPTGPLHCVPVLVKDQFETRDMSTTYGSAAFRDFVPTRDATAVRKLREAGALIIGKATMGEFASGYAGSVSGPIRNPYDPRRHPSGSSGGTGAGMAADFAAVGLAEDTGGSIRAPAAAGSLVGHRPTLPLVSRHGMLPARPTTDTVGPIARSVRDAALMLDVIAGFDPNDPATAYAPGRLPRSFTSSLSGDAFRGTRIGVVRQPMFARTDPAAADYREIRGVFDRALTDVRRLGAELDEAFEVPNFAQRISRSYDDNVFETEEAINAYLAQHSSAPAKTLREVLLVPGGMLPWRARGLLATVGRSREELGYLRVLMGVEDLRREVLALMAVHRLDALVYPTADHHPRVIAADIMSNPNADGDTRLGSNRTLASVLGFPAITVPAGFTSETLPVGLEFMGRAFDDAKILAYAYAYERATLHRRLPKTTPPLGR